MNSSARSWDYVSLPAAHSAHPLQPQGGGTVAGRKTSSQTGMDKVSRD